MGEVRRELESCSDFSELAWIEPSARTDDADAASVSRRYPNEALSVATDMVHSWQPLVRRSVVGGFFFSADEGTEVVQLEVSGPRRLEDEGRSGRVVYAAGARG